MNNRQRTQHGASVISIIIILAIIGACTYIGLQYFPKFVEAGRVKSIMGSLEKSHAENSATSVENIRDMIDKQLDMNQMEDLRDNFKVLQDDESFIATVSYERGLNLTYEKKTMQYEKP